MTELDKLIEIAWKLRMAFERVSKARNWSDDLFGMCYCASCLIHKIATNNRIATEIGRGDGHFFILYGGDIVIDITSTQFNQPDRVAVMPLKQAEKIGSWWKLKSKEYAPVTESMAMDWAEEEFDKICHDMDRLIALAHQVRTAFERTAVRDNWSTDLCGLCYHASKFLHATSVDLGIDTHVVGGVGHYFVMYGDFVIDVTSTQFGQPDKVAVKPLVEAEKIGPWWQKKYDCRSSSDLTDKITNIAREEFGKILMEQQQPEEMRP